MTGDPYGSDPTCNTCNTYCPIIPTHVWNGFPPYSQPVPNCMEITYTGNTSTFYWTEANCDRHKPALWEIDFREVGCHAFGISGITSPKWRSAGNNGCDFYEQCVNGVLKGPTPCPSGTKFDEFASPPDCYPSENANECSSGGNICFSCSQYIICMNIYIYCFCIFHAWKLYEILIVKW